MQRMIPHSRPVFDARYAQASNKVIQSGFLACGDEVTHLQTDIGQQLQRQHVLAVDSGTSALMLSIRALLKHQSGRVGIPAYACASLLFAVKAAGATPVFMDCNANLVLEQNQAWETSKTLDVLVLVHPFGMVEPLVGHDFPCPVIEDIAQAVGASFQGQAVGAFTALSIGSLYATKPWGGAYGGFIAAENQHDLNAIQKMINPDQADIQQPYAGHHQLSNIHAALARQRIATSDVEQKKRLKMQGNYDNIIENTSFSPICAINDAKSNGFRYLVNTPSAKHTMTQLRQMGIAASMPVQQPLHLASMDASACPNAMQAWQHCVSLPMLADMAEHELEIITRGLQSC